VRPTVDENDLQELHRLPLDALRPQFQVELKRLAQAVFAAAKPPTVAAYRSLAPSWPPSARLTSQPWTAGPSQKWRGCTSPP